MTPTRAALLYFAIVFALGFALGVLRITFLVPLVGEQSAELIELPVMVLASFFAARWIVLRCWNTGTTTSPVYIGALALFFLLSAEVLFWVTLREEPLAALWTERDPVSGTAYLFALLFFAAAPSIVVSRLPRGR